MSSKSNKSKQQVEITRWSEVNEDFWSKNRESKVDEVQETVKGIVDMVR